MGFKNKEPKIPSDLKGVKMRTLGSSCLLQQVRVSAVSVNTPEVPGLERESSRSDRVYATGSTGGGESPRPTCSISRCRRGLVFWSIKETMAKLSPPTGRWSKPISAGSRMR